MFLLTIIFLTTIIDITEDSENIMPNLLATLSEIETF